MSRCIWSAREGGGRLKTLQVPGIDRLGRPAPMESFLILPEYERDFRRFRLRLERYGRWHLPGIVFMIALLLLASLSGYWWAMGMVVVGLGAWIAWLPFATPETVALVGVEKSIILARAAAVVLMLFGLLLIFSPTA